MTRTSNLRKNTMKTQSLATPAAPATIERFTRKSILYKTLGRALSLMRPHEGTNTALFTRWLAEHLPRTLRVTAKVDGAGNLHVDNRKDNTSRTLFVAHVDTVHRLNGPNKIRKTPGMWYADGAPLGADDGAGCAMLMHLIYSDVPGYYIFTQGEECGGIGAKYLVKHHPDILAQFDRAIAFDRRGIDSVITHQGWGRCCSDKFADALADELNNTPDMMMYLPDNTGVYTDTAEFTEIIPECTNISVGYFNEHGSAEKLDMLHFEDLARAVTTVGWDQLPVERDPHAPDPDYKLDQLISQWKYGGFTRAEREEPCTTYAPAYYEDDEAYTDSDEAARNTARDYYDGLDPDDYEDVVRDAVRAAYKGMTRELVHYMCYSVYPEDIALASRFVDAHKITDEVLEEFEADLDRTDVDTALTLLFDKVYTG